MSYLHPEISFHAYNGNFERNYTSAVPIVFDSTYVNNGNCFKNGQFTAPVKGLYRFGGTFLHRASTTFILETTFNLNGTGVGLSNGGRGLGYTSGAGSGDHDMINIELIIELNPGDRIQPAIHNISGGDCFTGKGLSSFSGELIGLT